jgi:hypothetical protein
MAAAEATCSVCGAAPAAAISIRRHVGMILLQKFVKLRTPLCRDCGKQAVKEFTLQTLWQGWWGYISFFVNWFVLAANLVAFLRFRKLGAPTRIESTSSSSWSSGFDSEPARETADVD